MLGRTRRNVFPFAEVEGLPDVYKNVAGGRCRRFARDVWSSVTSTFFVKWRKSRVIACLILFHSGRALSYLYVGGGEAFFFLPKAPFLSLWLGPSCAFRCFWSEVYPITGQPKASSPCPSLHSLCLEGSLLCAGAAPPRDHGAMSGFGGFLKRAPLVFHQGDFLPLSPWASKVQGRRGTFRTTKK